MEASNCHFLCTLESAVNLDIEVIHKFMQIINTLLQIQIIIFICVYDSLMWIQVNKLKIQLHIFKIQVSSLCIYVE